MSRIGKQVIDIPTGVEITSKDGVLTVKWPKGQLLQSIADFVSVTVSEGKAEVSVQKPDHKEHKAHWGLVRSLLQNMIIGVTEGFKKSIEIHGVGYKFDLQGKKLILSVGYSHKVEKTVPDDVDAVIDEKDAGIMHISGIDKQRVGEFAAQVREVKKPEVYKGKGIRYVGEYVRRKAGKTGAK